MVVAKKRSELKEVLKEPKEVGVKNPYFVINGEAGQNITVVTPGKNGSEFNKTYGCFHDYPGVISFHVLYGEGVMVTQRNDENGEAKEVKIVSLRPGVTVEMPAGFGHCLVNIGRTYLVVVDDAPKLSSSNNYKVVQAKRGLAYYVVDKKGEVSFEANPSYGIHPQISVP